MAAGLTVQQRLRPVPCHHHALAPRPDRRPDHVRRPEGIEFAHEVGGIGHGAGVRGRDAGAAHDLLGEVLAALEGRAAAAVGPKARIPAARQASTAPATSGASGPTTTRSKPARLGCDRIRIVDVHRLGCGTTCAIPALPGAATTSLTCGSASRGHDEGVLPGSGADHQYAHASRVLGVLNWLRQPQQATRTVPDTPRRHP